jgi:hypothetical protein
VEVWNLVEVHPKVASLFLKGKTLREAFFLTRSIAAAIDPPCRDFIRGAVTSTAGVNPVCAMATAWARFDHGRSEQLELWFYKVVAKVAVCHSPCYSGSSSVASTPASRS